MTPDFQIFRNAFARANPYPDAGTESAKLRWEADCREAWDGGGRQRAEVLLSAQEIHSALVDRFKGEMHYATVSSDGEVVLHLKNGCKFVGHFQPLGSQP